MRVILILLWRHDIKYDMKKKLLFYKTFFKSYN